MRQLSRYMFLYIMIIGLSLIFGCTDNSESTITPIVINGGSNVTSMNETDINMVAEVDQTVTVRLVNPLTNAGVAGLNIQLESQPSGMGATIEGVTGIDGSTAVGAAFDTAYRISVQGEGYPTHHIVGELGDVPVTQISFVSDHMLMMQVFSALGLMPQPDKGTVVVGLDKVDLSPAIGASAELNTTYDQAFVLGSFGPSRGQTIQMGNGGFVSFANVEPGQIPVIVTPPSGSQCKVFPAEQNQRVEIPVFAGEVSVVAFTCR